jgi:uncharacterized protein (TIGR03067 family)
MVGSTRSAVVLAAELFAVAMLANSAVAAADESAKEDMARLQGLWTMAEYIIDGTRSNESQIRSWVLVVEGDQYNPGVREFSVEFTYRLNPTRNPKAIDLMPHTGNARGRTIRGIYRLDGDRFTLCYPADSQAERPAGFGARSGSGLIRVTWRRQGPGAPGSPSR